MSDHQTTGCQTTDRMSADRTSDGALLDVAPGRPLWLVTLADLALLLVGFFVLLQANQTLSPRELARGIAQGFGVEPAPAAMPRPRRSPLAG